MKRHLLSLTLSLLAANAFALPAAEQHLSAESRSSSVEVAQPLKTVAEGGADRLIERSGRVAEGGSDRLIERTGRVAEGGSDRLI
ncbi:MAG TPA: phage infection protein, partial [Pseudomonas sp.]|nr:phage infection protein [Pseudomonas sp.]